MCEISLLFSPSPQHPFDNKFSGDGTLFSHSKTRSPGFKSYLTLLGGSAGRAPPSTTDENKTTKTWSAWGGEVANLSKEKDLEPIPQ